MTIEKLRVSATYVVSAFALLMGVMGMLVEYFAQGAFGLATALTAIGLITLGVVFVAGRQSQAFRYTAVSVMMVEVIALLIAARGYPWQMDMHMAFFAALALCALMYDVRAVLLGTVLVAVHHLGLGMTLDTLVFYGGGNLPRVALHAGLLALEAAGLIWLTVNTRRLLAVADEKTRHAAGEAEKVRSFSETAEAERSARNDAHRAMMAELSAEMGGVVEAAGKGDFSRRVEAQFADPELEALAGGINRLVDSVERGLAETGTVLAALAHTDLTRRVEGQHEGAFDQLKTSTNAVADRMGEIIGRLRQTSSLLKTATGEILAGANDLSERTRKQAVTIQETAAAMAQLAETVQQSAQSAREASNVAAGVSRTADEGGQVMQNATGAMERINTSSDKISSIIGLIDDIAFQTNLLALNASVEAARAGDAGRGFAVVAVEVRRLAQSAAQASSEVKVLIEQSAGEVTSGSRLVATAAEKLEDMLAAARSNNLLMDGIARDSTQQASAIEEINAAVRQLDEMTQHNAALVEQTNAAIEQTEAQARALDDIVGVFTVAATSDAEVDPKPAGPEGARALQARVRKAARTYLSAGNAALDADWEDF